MAQYMQVEVIIIYPDLLGLRRKMQSRTWREASKMTMACRSQCPCPSSPSCPASPACLASLAFLPPSPVPALPRPSSPSHLLFFKYLPLQSKIYPKHELRPELSRKTGIPEALLNGSRLPSHYGIEERFTWVHARETRREEDMAYCMFGLFDVHMALIYGEGRQKAMARLRREIRESVVNEASASDDRTMQKISPPLLIDHKPLNTFEAGSRETSKQQSDTLQAVYSAPDLFGELFQC